MTQEYELFMKDMIQVLEILSQKRNSLRVMEEFSCREVNWKDLDTGENEESWGSKFVNFVVENMFVQWMVDLRGQAEPSRLDLVFTRDAPAATKSFILQIGKH